MSDSNTSQSSLPPALRAHLEHFRKRLWRAKIAESAFAGVIGLLASFLLVFALDRYWPTSGLLRLIILLVGASLSTIFAPYWLHRWIWRYRHNNQLARLIARKHPGMGDRLLGAIELETQQENADTLSPHLRVAAIQSVAAEVERRKLSDSLPVSRNRPWSLAAVALILLTIATVIISPQASLNALHRWLLPLSSTPRYTFTDLEGLPSEIHVVTGEAFPLEIKLSPNSRRHPAQASARFEKQAALIAPLRQDTDSYYFLFPGQQQRGFIQLEVGDFFHKILVIPSLRPTLTHVSAQIQYPEYLQYQSKSEEIQNGILQVVEGSSLSFFLEADRPLSQVKFGPAKLLRPLPVIEEKDSEEGNEGDLEQEEPPLAVKIFGTEVKTTEKLEIRDEALRIPLSWKDESGLSSTSNYELRIDPLPDNPPSVYLESNVLSKEILPEETITFKVTANDDFGLREMGFEWIGEAVGSANAPRGEVHLIKGNSELTHGSETAAFSPFTVDLKAQKVILRGFTNDYLPERKRIYSQPLTLYVITREQHAEKVKNRFDRNLRQLEDLTRQEQNLFEENQRLNEQDEEKFNEDETREKLLSQQLHEQKQAAEMEQLAEQMEQLFQEAVRNEGIDSDVLRQMADTMQSMQELGKKDIPEVEQKLGESADAANSTEKSSQDLADAVEKQEQVLEKMRDIAEKANEAKDQFEASTFVARLHKASANQSEVTNGVLKQWENFGLFPKELDPAVRGQLDELVRMQSVNTSDIRWIQEDLGHFFTRSDNPIFGKLFSEINASEIVMALEIIRKKISENQGGIASEESTQWANTLKEWAKMLENERQQSMGGGGGGDGMDQGEDEDFEFMLRIMRLVQHEQQIRSRTRALETLHRSKTNQEEAP